MSDKRVAVITGGARGIGLAAARALMRDNWRVVLTDRDTAALADAATELGGDTLTFPLDVSDVGQIRAVVGEIAREAGRLDCLVNNAGVFRNELLVDVEEQTYDWLMDINLKGAFFMLQACAKAMLAAGNGGVIINIASAAGRSGRPTQTVYGMTKAGLITLTKSAALAFGPHIRVGAICPAAIETEMWAQTVAQRRAVGGEADVQAFMARIPLGRPGTVEEVADLIRFYASPTGGAAFMTGTTLDISGGLEM